MNKGYVTIHLLRELELLERTRDRDGVTLTLEPSDREAPERDLIELVAAIEGSVVLVVAQ